MKFFKISSVFILGTLTLFLIPNANSVGCSPNIENKAEIECLSNDEKCLEAKEKELLYEVEA